MKPKRILTDEEMAALEASSAPASGAPGPIPTRTPGPAPAAPAPRARRVLSDEEMAKLESTPPPGTPGAGETFVRAAGDEISMGFLDEGIATVKALPAAFTPRERFLDAYTRYRDEERAKLAAGSAANPVAAGFGRGTGIAAGFLLPTGAVGLGVKAGKGIAGAAKAGAKAGAAIGGGSALGESEADLTKGELGGAALDVVKGVGLGTLTGGLVGGAAKGVSQLPAAVAGARVGVREAPQMPSAVATAVSKTVGAIQGASQGVRQADELAEAFRILKPMAARQGAPGAAQAVGSGKVVPGTRGAGPGGDDGDMLVRALWREGDNPVKQWRASAASTGAPGNLDNAALTKWENLGAERRVAARRYDPRESSKVLRSEFESFKEAFDGATTGYANTMQAAARKGTNLASDVGTELDLEIRRTLARAGKDPRAGGKGGEVWKTLSEVRKVLRTGKGNLDYAGDKGGKWEIGRSLPPQEALFDRLQWAKTTLQGLQKFNRDGKMPLAEKVGAQITDKIDDVIKKSAGKKEFDEFYSFKKRLDENFVNAITTGKGRFKKLDAPKLRSMLNDNANGARFREELDKAAEFVATHPAFEGRRAELLGPIERFREAARLVEDRRLDQAIRQLQGPTSPGLARAEATFQREGLAALDADGRTVRNAISNPHAFQTAADQFAVDTAKGYFGKPLSKLTDAEERNLARAWKWVTENPNASLGQKRDALARILEGGK